MGGCRLCSTRSTIGSSVRRHRRASPTVSPLRTESLPRASTGPGECLSPSAHEFPVQRLSRGKGLGGSTLINFLLWTRPQREEIDGKVALLWTPVDVQNNPSSCREAGESRLELGAVLRSVQESREVRFPRKKRDASNDLEIVVGSVHPLREMQRNIARCTKPNPLVTMVR